MTSKIDILKNYRAYIDSANKQALVFLQTHNTLYLRNAIKEYETFLNLIDITDYLLIDIENEYVPKNVYIESYFKLGTYHKILAEKEIENTKKQVKDYKLQDVHDQIYKKALFCFITVLRIEFEHKNSIVQLLSIYTQLCSHVQHDFIKSLAYLHEAMVFAPEDPILNYNLGFLYHKINKLEYSLTHYKLSIFLNQSIRNETEKRNNYINCYNGISGIFRSIKQWPEALHYLLKAVKIMPDEPNICNQLGIVYTEMRRTDIAEGYYKTAMNNVNKSIIARIPSELMSDIYLNLGHLYSYNGSNNEAIDCYNKALQINPTYTLAFQNKLFNLCYIYNDISDTSYISKQHAKINSLFKQIDSFTFEHLKIKELKQRPKLNIGIISGDFIDHPVSFFINTFLKKYNKDYYNVYCYSECVVDISSFNSQFHFKFIKNKSTSEVSDIIHSDRIHILLDLAGHTAFNRLDVFANKPAPIQISYIGYPYTTGLKNMDYRITDRICDHPEISQPHYTEKLLFLPNSFLCYKSDKIQPITTQQPFVKNGYITFCCFNRLNKINDQVIQLFNTILMTYPTSKFIFKTKGLNNNDIKNTFLNKFDESIRQQIIIKDCSIIHEQHLLEYNNVDIAIDTFPYSGTTTSCEALSMGVPVFSIYDDIHYYHPQNVTVSILKNSNLNEFVVKTHEQLISQISIMLSKENSYWSSLKRYTQNAFINGNICNETLYMQNMDNLLYDVFNTFNQN